MLKFSFLEGVVMQECPCGAGKSYQNCCGLYISGQKKPTTPEELMRSRYTAYTLANVDYIANTMRSPASDNFDSKAAKDWAESVEWLKLDIVSSKVESDHGWVEFLAHFRNGDKRHVIHELSEFHLINQQWFYVNGSQPKQMPRRITTLVGRNDPCECGSGVKFKKCCGNLK